MTTDMAGPARTAPPPQGAALELARFAKWSALYLARRIAGAGGALLAGAAAIAVAWFLYPAFWPLWQTLALLLGAATLTFLLLGYMRTHALAQQADEIGRLADILARTRVEASERMDALAAVMQREGGSAQAVQEASARANMALALLDGRIAHLEAALDGEGDAAEFKARLAAVESTLAERVDETQRRLAESIAMARADAARDLAAMREASAASVHALRLTAAEDAQALRASLAASMEALRQATAQNVETLHQATAQSLEALRQAMTQDLEAERLATAQNLEGLRQSAARDAKVLRVSMAENLEGLRQAAAQDAEALRASLAENLEGLRQATAQSLEGARLAGAQNLEALRQTTAQDLDALRTAVTEQVDALRARLEMADAAVSQSLDAAAQRQSGAETALAELRAAGEALAARIDGIGKAAEDMLADFAGRQAEAAAAAQARLQVAGDHITLLSNRLDTLEKTAQAAAAAIEREQHQRFSSVKAAEKKIDEAQKLAAQAQSEAASARSLIVRSSVANAAAARAVGRLLTSEKIARFEQHWLKVFGLTMTRSALAYLAHRIAMAEDRCTGRLACPIETAVLRQLALNSLHGDLEVMEIGTLFGIGGAALHLFAGPRRVRLTLIDPVGGYYGAGALDPVSGVEVSRETLTHNLATLGVPTSDWRLIQRLSTDPKAVAEASDRAYDLILIDGDHSVDGVARDFELYGPMVKPGGLVLFDDYGNPDWPGIQPYVDAHVRTLNDWVWIGGEYGTGIVRRATHVAAPEPTPRRRKKQAAESGG